MPEKAISVGRMRVNGVIDPSLVTITIADDGREFLNFPVKALRSQILECMNCLPGGEFVPASEIEKSLAAWAGQPLTIDHPVNERGELEFANRDARFRESVEVGTIDNPRFQGGFLWVDAHLDRVLAAVSTEGRGIIAALLGDGPDVEVSSGYGMTLNFEVGRFEGRRYQFAQSDIEPDHLALLPIGVAGACSIEDGCGAARAAQRLVAAAAGHPIEGDPTPDKRTAGQAIKDLVDAALRLAGIGADPATDPGDGAENSGGGGGTPSSEESGMDRNAVIAALVAAEGVPFSEAELEAFDDAKLTSLSALAGIDCGGCGGEGAAAEAAAREAAAAAAANTGGEGADDGDGDGEGDGANDAPQLSASDVATLKEFIAGIPAVTQMVASAQASVDAERETLVAALVTNERCAIPEAQLKLATLEMLRGLSSSFLTVDYSGQGGGFTRLSANADNGLMPMPAIVLAEPTN